MIAVLFIRTEMSFFLVFTRIPIMVAVSQKHNFPANIGTVTIITVLAKCPNFQL